MEQTKIKFKLDRYHFLQKWQKLKRLNKKKKNLLQMKKRTKKGKGKLMKKSKILEILGTEVNFQIQLRNTNKNQFDSIRHKRMLNKSTAKYLQTMPRIRKKKCINSLFSKETIIQLLKEYLLDDKTTGKSKLLHSQSFFISNGLLSVGKSCLTCFLYMVSDNQ